MHDWRNLTCRVKVKTSAAATPIQGIKWRGQRERRAYNTPVVDGGGGDGWMDKRMNGMWMRCRIMHKIVVVTVGTQQRLMLCAILTATGDGSIRASNCCLISGKCLRTTTDNIQNHNNINNWIISFVLLLLPLWYLSAYLADFMGCRRGSIGGILMFEGVLKWKAFGD